MSKVCFQAFFISLSLDFHLNMNLLLKQSKNTISSSELIHELNHNDIKI